MAAYLRFYQFDVSPFERSNQKRAMVLGTRSLRGAFDQVKHGLDEDSPRICLSGSSGVGKTSFCRALPRLMGDNAKVALVLDPRRSWREIRDIIAKKFDLAGGAISRRALLDAARDSKQLVLVIDEAQLLSHESLDHLDILLQYKLDDGKQLLHCVMLADLDSAATGAEIPLLWWLDKLTTLQLQFSPIPVEGLRHYVEKHLAKAGWAGGELFTEGALEAVHHNTGGVPRAINQLCERILMEGGARGITSISAQFIEGLCGELAEPEIERPRVSNSDMSSDFSIGDFGTSPSAQELLDAAASEPEPVSYEETRIAPDSEYLKSRPPELHSLILTQDSDEVLHVDSTPKTEKAHVQQHSLTIELEDDPTQNPDIEKFRAPASVGASRVRNRPAIESRPPRVYSGKIIAAVILLIAAYWINSQFSLPAELIDRAEVKITNALDRRPAIQTAQEPASAQNLEEIEIVEMKPQPRQSLIDRADRIAGETGLDSIPLPDVDDDAVADLDENDETGKSAELAEVKPEVDDVAAAVIPALKPAPRVAAKQPAESLKLSQTPLPSTESKPSIAVEIKSKSTAKISDELVVINEYTAIPEAAESAPGLAIPGTAKAEAPPAMIDPETSIESKPASEDVDPVKATDRPAFEAQPPAAEPSEALPAETTPVAEKEPAATAGLT